MEEQPENQEQRASAREARTEASAVAREARAETSAGAREARAETLAAVAEGLEALSRAVETNMSEERLAGIVASEQLVNQRKFQRLNLILVLTLVVIITGLTSIWVQSRANHDQGARTQRIGVDAAAAAGYVRGCLVVPAAQRDPVLCGPQDTTAVVRGLVAYWRCVVLLAPPTGPKLDACAAQAFGER